MAVLGCCRERNYVQSSGDRARAMQREIATINPDPAYFRSFPTPGDVKAAPPSGYCSPIVRTRPVVRGRRR